LISRRALFTLDLERPPRPAGALVRVHRTAMACRVEVAFAAQDAHGVAAARRALNEADRTEALLTVFRDTSELARINREAASPQGARGVDRDVYALLRQCERLYGETAGAFDITSTPLSRCWGFLARQGLVPLDAELEAARRLVGMSRVIFDAATRTVRFEREGMQLNLGAIGKGFALDRMANTLRADGVRDALLSAGSSSIVAIGGRRGGWSVDVVSPLVARSRIARLRLRDGALGTSGPGEQFVIADGTRYGHVIDPRTGRPARGVLSASVATAYAATADALSTAFLVGGCALADAYCAAHPDTLALLTVDDEEQRTFVFGRSERVGALEV
jgi:thiamine biosynthesis lipoprotein